MDKEYFKKSYLTIIGGSEQEAELWAEYQIDCITQLASQLDPPLMLDDRAYKKICLFLLFNRVSADPAIGDVAIYRSIDGSLFVDLTPKYWAKMAAQNGCILLPPEFVGDNVFASVVIGNTRIVRKFSKSWVDNVRDFLIRRGMKDDTTAIEGAAIKSLVRGLGLSHVNVRGDRDFIGIETVQKDEPVSGFPVDVSVRNESDTSMIDGVAKDDNEDNKKFEIPQILI